jgi:hypothetical protein
MAPLPRLCASEPLEAGQTTIFSTLNGALALAKPTPPPRPGPHQKSTSQADTVLGRRLVGSLNEKQTLQLFATIQLSQSNTAEPGDSDIVNETVVLDDEVEDDEYNYFPQRRYTYSREHKLAAINYFQTTWKQNDDNTFERLSVQYTSQKLKITQKMLQSWVLNKEKIQAQKRGSFQSNREYCAPQEPAMESQLNTEFEKAREQGRKISYKWILRHARAIYSQLHPDRVIQRKGNKKTYLGFRFSNGWYRGFRKRYYISLRCGTKRAQKSPKELLPVIQNWLQFNR